MSLTRNQLTLVLVVTGFYLTGQLMVGTDALVASLFAIAILFGLLSVLAGGGLASAFGCLNAILIGKFLLFGIATKILFMQPADDRLNAPAATALVMAIGFAGLFVGTLAQAYLPCTQSLSINRALSDGMLLSLSIVSVRSQLCRIFRFTYSSRKRGGPSNRGLAGDCPFACIHDVILDHTSDVVPVADASKVMDDTSGNSGSIGLDQRGRNLQHN
jgi:hypothetical protein